MQTATKERTLFNQRLTFADYDEAHPEVWSAFERIALDLIATGIRRYGAKAIFEVIRYYHTVNTNENDFKVNNNFTADYARKFAEEHPEHKDFFSFRGREVQ